MDLPPFSRRPSLSITGKRALAFSVGIVSLTLLMSTVVHTPSASALGEGQRCPTGMKKIASKGFVHNGLTYAEAFVYAGEGTKAPNTVYCTDITVTPQAKTKGTVKNIMVTLGKADGSGTLATTKLIDSTKHSQASVRMTTTRCVFWSASATFRPTGETKSVVENFAKSTNGKNEQSNLIALCGPGSTGPATQRPTNLRYSFNF